MNPQPVPTCGWYTRAAYPGVTWIGPCGSPATAITPSYGAEQQHLPYFDAHQVRVITQHDDLFVALN
jgi:hypothetical protein